MNQKEQSVTKFYAAVFMELRSGKSFAEMQADFERVFIKESEPDTSSARIISTLLWSIMEDLVTFAGIDRQTELQ